MGEPAVQEPPKSVVSIYPPLVLIAFAVLIFLVARGYDDAARKTPQAVSVILGVLGLMDLWCRTKLPGNAVLRDFWGASFSRREMTHSPSLPEELRMVLWSLGAFVAMALIGILAGLPIFAALYIRLHTRRSLRLAAMVAVGLLIFEYAVFELLLDYELYRGLLFSEGGLSRW